MMATNRWYWWGVLVSPKTDRIKQRQYHVYLGDHGFVVESWSKGLDGTMWSVNQFAWGIPSFKKAMEIAQEQQKRWGAAYTTVDEGEPWQPDYEQASRSTTGGGDPDWWARVLDVNPDDNKKTVQSAYRDIMRATHPDVIGDNTRLEEATSANLAWEYAKELKGW